MASAHSIESICEVQLHREGAGELCRVNENVAELSLGSSSRCLGAANVQISHAGTIYNNVTDLLRLQVYISLLGQGLAMCVSRFCQVMSSRDFQRSLGNLAKA